MAQSLAEFHTSLVSPEGKMAKLATDLDTELAGLEGPELQKVWDELQAEKKQASMEKEGEELKAAGAFMGEGFYGTEAGKAIKDVAETIKSSGLTPEGFGVAVMKCASLYDSLEEATASQPQPKS